MFNDTRTISTYDNGASEFGAYTYVELNSTLVPIK